MDITEEIVVPAKSPKTTKKRKQVKKSAEPKLPPLPAEGIFAGMSGLNCPQGCRADLCVISGVGICAHPHKGGLQPQLQNPESLRRFNEAKEILAHRKLRVSGE